MITYEKCLMIIDPQKDFISLDGFYALRHGKENITKILKARNNINRLLAKIPGDIPVIIVYSDYYPNQFGKNISMCIPHTEGHKIDILYNDKFLYFAKNEHSAFTSPDLKKYLSENFINEIYLAGFLAEYCVKQTAMDAIKNNYRVTLLRDCIATGDHYHYRDKNSINEVINAEINISDSTDCFK